MPRRCVQVWLEFCCTSREDYHTYGAVAIGGDRGEVAGEVAFTICLQGQLIASLQLSCCGIPCLAHLDYVLEPIEEVGHSSSQ